MTGTTAVTTRRLRRKGKASWRPGTSCLLPSAAGWGQPAEVPGVAGALERLLSGVLCAVLPNSTAPAVFFPTRGAFCKRQGPRTNPQNEPKATQAVIGRRYAIATPIAAPTSWAWQLAETTNRVALRSILHVDYTTAVPWRKEPVSRKNASFVSKVYHD